MINSRKRYRLAIYGTRNREKNAADLLMISNPREIQVDCGTRDIKYGVGKSCCKVRFETEVRGEKSEPWSGWH